MQPIPQIIGRSHPARELSILGRADSSPKRRIRKGTGHSLCSSLTGPGSLIQAGASFICPGELVLLHDAATTDIDPAQKSHVPSSRWNKTAFGTLGQAVPAKARASGPPQPHHHTRNDSSVSGANSSSALSLRLESPCSW